jgi:hypothetical protein
VIRLVLVAGVVALAAVLFVVLRPEDDEPATATAPGAMQSGTTTEETTGDATTTEETTTEEAGPPPPERISVRFRGGRVVGGVERFRVERGREVVFVVRSDVADHVHLHGYDLLVDVVPGRPSQIRFRAELAGSFEAELEDRHLPLAVIEVRP